MMSTAWRWLSRVALVFLALIAVLAAIWAYGRLTSPTAAQREALAVMQSRAPMPEGANGFDLLMALPAPPEGELPTLPVCADAGDCIARIEQTPEQSGAAIEARRERFEAAAIALRAPAFRDLRDDATWTDSLPSYSEWSQLSLLRAFDFATGQTQKALDEACQDAQGAMRRASSPDVLIDGGLGAAMFGRYAALIADMRRRAPQDAVPASCDALAVAPDAVTEGMICEAMRGEWHFLTRVMRQMGDEVPSTAPRWALPLMHDEAWLLARTAERYAPMCSAAAERAAREDRPMEFARLEQRWVDRVSFPVTVILDAIAEPAYNSFSERQLDHVARRRLLAALLQMDAMDPALTSQQRFDALPAALRDGPRPLTLQDEGRTLQVLLRGRRGDDQAPNGARLPLVDRCCVTPVAASRGWADAR